MKPIINPWLFYLIKYDMDELDEVKVIKTIKKKIIVIALLITFAIFLPSKKTCYQMMIASQITDNNIQKAEDVIKNSVDYIFEKINEK